LNLSSAVCLASSDFVVYTVSTLPIAQQDTETQLIDTTIPDISNYVEKFETSVTAKVIVKTDVDVCRIY